MFPRSLHSVFATSMALFMALWSGPAWWHFGLHQGAQQSSSCVDSVCCHGHHGAAPDGLQTTESGPFEGHDSGSDESDCHTCRLAVSGITAPSSVVEPIGSTHLVTASSLAEAVCMAVIPVISIRPRGPPVH